MWRKLYKRFLKDWQPEPMPDRPQRRGPDPLDPYGLRSPYGR
jgi:hypothetical protein